MTQHAQLNTALENQSFTKHLIGFEDRIWYQDLFFDVEQMDDEGIAIKTCAEEETRRTVTISFQELDRLIGLGKLEVDSGYYDGLKALERGKKLQTTDLAADTILRSRMVGQFIEEEQNSLSGGKKLGRSDKNIIDFIERFEKQNTDLLPKPRGGKKVPSYRDKGLVGPRQFRRLLQRFEQGAFIPASLTPRYKGRKTDDTKWTAEEMQYHLRFARAYQSTKRPTQKACYEDLLAEQARRKERGQPELKIPSLRTFQRIIRSFGDFENEYARTENKMRVLRKYAMAGKGLLASKPLEIVEMDEHRVDLVRLLVRNGIWDYLHPEIQARIEKNRRPWFSVAIDVYSRSICAAKLIYGTPDASTAVATLAMVARSKTAYAKSLGANTDWPQSGTPEIIHTDAGSAYVSAEFQAAAYSLTGRHAILPAKRPNLRGRVERFFRTLNQRYMHLFSGQTFSNVLLRDQYDSEAHASMTTELLNDLLIRLIVDCYHNTPHRALLGATPLQIWYRGSQLAHGAIKPVPPAAKYRDIFGITDTRVIGDNGIEILGLPFVSPQLRALRKQWRRSTLLIRVNDQDLSEISVKHLRLDRWMTVPAVFEGLEGVTIAEWIAAVRYIKRRFKTEGALDWEVARKAIEVVKESAQAAELEHGIRSHAMNGADLRRVEENETAEIQFSKKIPFDTGEQPEEIDFLVGDDGAELVVDTGQEVIPPDRTEAASDIDDDFDPLDPSPEQQSRMAAVEAAEAKDKPPAPPRTDATASVQPPAQPKSRSIKIIRKNKETDK
ncbi:transposase [Rhizobium sp. Rhizsp82]|uniref:transposase n=1 Tax=Rhizobium sp. Rhizsp82 TaxID=3243057 RepID=UPI0039B3BF90